MSNLNLGPDKSDGQKLYGSDWNELKKKLEEWANDPQIGNSNIDEAEKLAYNKLNLSNSIIDADIKSISINKFTSLKAQEQDTPNLTVQVGAGTYIAAYGAIHKTYAGGNSPAFDVSGITSGNSRIDLLYIDDAGTLKIYQGLQAVTPVPPKLKIGLTPICYVYLRYTSSAIYNTDQGGSSAYIYADLRPFFYFPQRLAFSGNDIFEHWDREDYKSDVWTYAGSGTGQVDYYPAEHKIRVRVNTNYDAYWISKASRSVVGDSETCGIASIFEIRCKGSLVDLNNSQWGLVDQAQLFNVTQCARIIEGTSAGTVKFETKDASASTITDNISATDDWHIWTIIINEDSAKLFKDGILVATHTTNIPTIAMKAIWQIDTNPATLKDYYCDYIKWFALNLSDLAWE